MVCKDIPAVSKFFELLVAKADNVQGKELDVCPKSPQLGRPERKMIRITRVKNRFDLEYDATELSQGYRDLSLNVEVGWIKHDTGLEFIPVNEWMSRTGVKRHICEIQVHVERVFEATGRYHRASGTKAVRNYHTFRDLMSR